MTETPKNLDGRERGIDLNGCDYDKRTPLHLAAAEGLENVVSYLINKKVNLNAKDRWGNTPLDDAKRHEQHDIISLLKKTKQK